MILYLFMALPSHYLHSHSTLLKSVSKSNYNSFSENSIGKISKVDLECSVCKLLNSNIQVAYFQNIVQFNDGRTIPSSICQFHYPEIFTEIDSNRGPPSIV